MPVPRDPRTDTAAARALQQTLWRIYRRPERPSAWVDGGNLPWNEPAFSARMLREHLDDTHSAASRTSHERSLQIDWLWQQLGLAADHRVLDFTCGPGLYAVELARRGCAVTGIDFGPASIAYAHTAAALAGVADRCTFVEADVRQVELPGNAPGAPFDAALFLYGQLAVFRRDEAQALLAKLAAALRPGAPLCIELLDQNKVDKTDHATWWYTDEAGLWGDAPYLHLGERFWDAELALSHERFYIVHLPTGRCTEVQLCDQTYSPAELTAMLHQAGFTAVEHCPNWSGLDLYDAQEWDVYVAWRGEGREARGET